ncbi:MAG: hypothetical protein IJ251_10065 [Oscillospiraceae bacterium]|nr:hypothetical protein [Oscillospiraceae bacterium]
MRYLSEALTYGSVTLDMKNGYIQRAEPTGGTYRKHTSSKKLCRDKLCTAFFCVGLSAGRR